MIVFAAERLNRSTQPPAWMLHDHYVENAPLKDTLKLDPDWSRYFEAQEKGEFLWVTARQAGSIVGYMAVFLHPHPHYKGTIVAVDDVHYLMPVHRGNGNGKALIAFAEKAAFERGARVFSMRTKAEQSHGPLFEKLGYRLVDLVYVKELTDV